MESILPNGRRIENLKMAVLKDLKGYGPIQNRHDKEYGNRNNQAANGRGHITGSQLSFKGVDQYFHWGNFSTKIKTAGQFL